MDKTLSHMDSLVASAAAKQGGASRGQGADSAKDPKPSGDAVTHKSFYTRQDDARDGRVKNKFHDV